MCKTILFFWDTVQLGSKHAHFFFQNGLHWAPLPVEMDSGHPPAFGYYLALLWTVFGKSLPTGHWGMLPFLFGITWLLFRLGRRYGGPQWTWWLLPFVFLDPVMAGQSTLVGPDIVLVFCFLLTLEGILSRASGWVVFGALGLCAISTRGMMTAAALFVWQLMASWRPEIFFKPARNGWLAFLPGFGFAAGFLAWHLNQTGWIGYHPESPWAAAFQPVGLSGFLKNILVCGWRWLDAGRIVEWGVLGYLVWAHKGAAGKKLIAQNSFITLALLFLCLLFFLTPSALIYQNLSAHRYFLPLFLGFHLLVLHVVAITHIPMVKKRVLAVFLVLGLASGNLWIYPRGISMDWDATLAYLPYHALRAAMLRHLDERQIDYTTVGSTFPNVNTGENLLLNGDQRQFADKDFSRNTYIFTSNIFNDFSKPEHEILERDWVLEKKIERAGVWVALFRRQK